MSVADDTQTDQIHGLKFYASILNADIDFGTQEPILLHRQKLSISNNSLGIEEKADLYARHYAFLMQQIGLNKTENWSAIQITIGMLNF